MAILKSVDVELNKRIRLHLISGLDPFLTSRINRRVQLALGPVTVERTQRFATYGGKSALAKRACILSLGGEEGT